MNHGEVIAQMAGKSVAELGDAIPDEVRNKTPEELRQIVDIVDAHLRSLHQEDNGELRDLTVAEQTAFSYGIKVREHAIKRIEEHRAVSEVFARRPESVKKVYANIRNGIDGGNHVTRMLPAEARDMALRTLDDRRAAAHLRSDEKDQLEQQIHRNPDVARRIIVTENDDYRSAWLKLVTQPDGAMFLEDEERDAMKAYAEYRAASSSSGSGGYGVPVFIDPSIMLTAQGSRNPFMQIAKQTDINTNTWKGVTSAGVSWSFDAEANEVSDDAPSMLQPTVSINTARGFIPFSIEIGEDYPAFASEMSRLLTEGYDELLIDKFTRGTGTNEPNGVLTVLSASAGNRVGIQTSGSNFGSSDPYTLYEAVPQRFRFNASWLMSVNVNDKMRQLGGTNVYHAYTVNLPAAWMDTLLGRSVYESPYMPNTTTSTSANTGLAVLGDFSNYLIARRTGMSVELIPHLFATANNLPSGQRGWFAYSRIGGNVVNTAAFRLLVNTA
jgi:HK97 family phage major capsid protein